MKTVIKSCFHGGLSPKMVSALPFLIHLLKLPLSSMHGQRWTILTLWAFLLSPAWSQEFYGCGGFIKSDAVIDFSRIEIKLYTKQGALKDSTDCAPNNGYYLIPVYDKGEYVIKVGQLCVEMDSCGLFLPVAFLVQEYQIYPERVSISSHFSWFFIG